MSWQVLKILPFASMLELGCNAGEVYRFLEPADYLGVDLFPRFEPGPGGSVLTADVFSWDPPDRHFDLVFCDAHDSTDSPKLFAVTARQIEIARKVSPWWIAIDDCWVDEICRAAVMSLSAPAICSNDETKTWVWEMNQ